MKREERYIEIKDLNTFLIILQTFLHTTNIFERVRIKVSSLKMDAAPEYSLRVVQEGELRCKKKYS